MKCPKCGKQLKRVKKGTFECRKCRAKGVYPFTYHATYFEVVKLDATGEFQVLGNRMVLKQWQIHEDYERMRRAT